MTAVSIQYKQTMRFSIMVRPKATKIILKTPTLENRGSLNTAHLVEADDVADKGVVELSLDVVPVEELKTNSEHAVKKLKHSSSKDR